MRFYTKVGNRHGGESDSYEVRVRAGAGDVTVEFEWKETPYGAVRNNELALEPDAARWLAYALLKTLEEQADSATRMERGARKRVRVSSRSSAPGHRGVGDRG